jgi:hypothetical protein
MSSRKMACVNMAHVIIVIFSQLRSRSSEQVAMCVMTVSVKHLWVRPFSPSSANCSAQRQLEVWYTSTSFGPYGPGVTPQVDRTQACACRIVLSGAAPCVESFRVILPEEQGRGPATYRERNTTCTLRWNMPLIKAERTSRNATWDAQTIVPAVHFAKQDIPACLSHTLFSILNVVLRRQSYCGCFSNFYKLRKIYKITGLALVLCLVDELLQHLAIETKFSLRKIRCLSVRRRL